MNRLIFDRTQSDITNKTQKGYYNYWDLNRVEEWCQYLHDELVSLNYTPTSLWTYTKTNWTASDMRTAGNMNRIKNNIRSLMYGFHYIHNIYGNVENFNYTKANNWEQILSEIYGMMLGFENYQVYSGVSASGQRRLYQNRFRHFGIPASLGDALETELGTAIGTESGEDIDVEIGICITEDGNFILSEEGTNWEVE